jgi:hypothetical protein
MQKTLAKVPNKDRRSLLVKEDVIGTHEGVGEDAPSHSQDRFEPPIDVKVRADHAPEQSRLHVSMNMNHHQREEDCMHG